MELFDEVKNRYFQLVLRVVNESAEGKAASEIIKIIDEGEFKQRVIGKNQTSFADLMLNRCNDEENLNILREQNGRFYPSVQASGNTPLPVRFANIEKAWLKALLDQPGISMTLSKETIEKLQDSLVETDTPIRKEYMDMSNTIELPELTQLEIYEKNFKLILEALNLEKPMRYTNTDKLGNVYRDKLALPINLEYSMRDSRFRVALYSLDDNRPIMANIFTLSDLRIVDEQVPMDRETAKNLLFAQKYSQEPVVLEVTDRKAVMERCFMCFSGLERTAKIIGRNKYELRLNYYLFEEEDLIRNIISLGPYVKVLSPQRIADEIVSRVKKSLEFAAR
jgi:hypothetical protein